VEDGLADPPHRIGDELDVLPLLRGIVFLRGLNQPEVALVDEVEEGNVRVAIPLGIRDHEAEVGFHHLTYRIFVAGLNALGELDFLVMCQRWIAGDLLEVPTQGRYLGVRCGAAAPGHSSSTTFKVVVSTLTSEWYLGTSLCF
jgi:hypothetical protein